MAQIGDRITITATVKNKHEYQTYFGWQTQTHPIYVFEDAEGQVYVWNTQSWLHIKTGTITSETGETRDLYEAIERGDVVTIKGTIKDFGEYNGTPQTVLTRVKVIGRTFRADRWEEIQAAKQAAKEAKREAQLASLKGEDFVWEMPYAQYMEELSSSPSSSARADSKHQESEVKNSIDMLSALISMTRSGHGQSIER